MLTQVAGEYTHAEPMASSDVDWVMSPDGQTGVAYDYGEAGDLVFYELTGEGWRFARRIELAEPVYHIFPQSPRRYLMRTENAFVLRTEDSERAIASTEQFSDAHLTGKYIVLATRVTDSVGTDHTDIQILDDQLSVLFAHHYREKVMISSTSDGEAILLSEPGAVTVVAGRQISQIAVGRSEYVMSGYDGTLVFTGIDRVATRQLGRCEPPQSSSACLQFGQSVSINRR